MKSFLSGMLLLLGMPILAQRATLDSLAEVFTTAEADSVRWRLAGEIANAYSLINSDSNLYWSQRQYALANRLGDSLKIGQSHFHIGVAQFKKNDFLSALEHFIEAKGIFDRHADLKRSMDTQLEIGRVYVKIEEFEQAKRMIDEAYQYYLQEEDGASVIFTLALYVLLYEYSGKPDSMLIYARETLEAAKRYGIAKNLDKIHNNLAATYLYNGMFDQAKYHFKRAEEIGFKDDQVGRYFNRYALADLYFSTGQLDSSLYFARQALERAREYVDIKKEADVTRLISETYARKGDYRQAFDQLQEFMVLADSQMMMQHKRDIAELTIQYETQQKEARIAQQELQIQKEVNRRNGLLFGGFAGLLLLGGLFGYVQMRSRSRQRQAEMDLQLKEAEAEQLRELDELKSNFFANISHEFRTPLTLILGPLREMAQNRFKGDVQASQRTMIRNAERLLQLVNQLLELARLESGHARLDIRPLDLAGFLRPLVHSFESWAMRKQIYFQVQLPEGPLPVQADADKLEKIVANLLSNALKFTPKQGRVNVRLETQSLNAQQLEVLLEVQDTGPGIPEDQLPHIFDRFYSPPGEDREITGSGIGLALTRELVELHGGRILVESEAGRGSTFRVRLPLQRAGLEELQVVSAKQQIHPSSEEGTEAFQRTNSRKPIVLLVEDHPDLRNYIRSHLEGDYQLVEAAHGKQGLELATELIPDLVLTDVMMPEMDGLSLCETLKTDERSSHIPVIMLTALSEQGDKLSGLRTGADAYLTKPFDPEELQVMVKNLIEQRRLLREKFAAGLQKREVRTQDFVSPAEESFLQKVAEIVEKNLDNEDFSIEELGRAVGMSRSQLHRKIKAITDLSPSVYVRTLRLRHAYQLLERKAGNISEVAFQVGIPNLAYFSRCFSEQYGFPPSELLHHS